MAPSDRDWLHKSEATYNSGIHKGHNLALFVVGWGAWVVVTSAEVWGAELAPHGRAILGAAYVCAGGMSLGLIRRTGRELVGLSLVTGALASIALGEVVRAVAEHGAPTAWPPTPYTYGSLALIGVTAIKDYIRGTPDVR